MLDEEDTSLTLTTLVSAVALGEKVKIELEPVWACAGVVEVKGSKRPISAIQAKFRMCENLLIADIGAPEKSVKKLVERWNSDYCPVQALGLARPTQLV